MLKNCINTFTYLNVHDLRAQCVTSGPVDAFAIVKITTMTVNDQLCFTNPLLTLTVLLLQILCRRKSWVRMC